MNNFTYLRQLVVVTLFSAFFLNVNFLNAQVVRPFNLMYSDNIRGSHLIFGNTSMAIRNSAGGVDIAKMNDFGSYSNGTTSRYVNDDYNMQFVDIDGGAPPSTTIIATGDTWSYSTGSSEPAGWPNISASLPGGPGASPLAYGNTGMAVTTLTDIRTYYFEKKVTLNPALYSSFTFNLTLDDGAVVYVNGTEVGRANMPSGSVSYTTNASSNVEPEQAYSFTVSTGAPFINGVNSITVETHTSANNENGTDDLFFDLRLSGNGINATANSSSANLVLPTGSNTIKYARLYWAGRINSGMGGAGNINLRTAKIKYGSGAYSTVVAPAAQVDKVLISGSDTAYQAYQDITAFVNANGAGTYTVADIKAATGTPSSGGYFAGWCIVVVYENPSLTFSSVRLYDGYLQVYSGGAATTRSITLTGFNAPSTPLSSSDAVMSVMALEGDAGLAASNGNPNGDFVKINGNTVSNALNPAVNMWNGTITDNGAHVTTKNPHYLNQFGIDIDRVNVGTGYGIVSNATSVTVEFGTEADQYFPSIFGFTVATKDPTVTLDKTVNDAQAPFNVLEVNEILTYTLSGSNQGTGPAVNCVVVDTLPLNVLYVPGSLEVVSSPGITPGIKSDGVGDDEAFKATVAGKDYIKFYIGTGATSTSGGVLLPSESYSLRFKVQATSNPFALSTVSNTARITANAMSGELYTDDGTANIDPAPGGILAVKLSAFTVKKENGTALLKWTTESEIKNDIFYIERSLDGINFSKIGSVKGNGTTGVRNNYQFTGLLNNISASVVYYRLRIVDIDGKNEFSKIVPLRLDGSITVNNLSVYPNPFTNHIKFSMNSTKEENITVRISNINGQQVIKRLINIQPGENIVVLKDLELLKSGTHVLEMITADGIVTQKIVKQ